jgi:hypothetical protein
MILVAFAMVGILALAALSIDLITLYLARSEAQRAADAAALAAARVIAISGVTGDPHDSSVGTVFSPWSTVCTLATQVAQSVANQNAISGVAASTVNVNFLYNGSSAGDCSSPSQGFAVNPQVQVQVQRTSLPTFFARIWRQSANSVSATATAEVYNPSGSSGLLGGTTVPVQPRCVKPWVVPDLDPLNPPSCTSSTCNKFVKLTDGSIQNPGISLGGGSASGVIGETFNLFNDCHSTAAPCPSPDNPPLPNVGSGTYDGNPSPPGTPNLEYLPGQVPSTFTAVPSCGDDSDYQKAVAGCDQTTVYQCGVAGGNTVDLSHNPGGASGDTAVGTQCLINQSTLGTLSGQDTLDTTSYPFTLKGGTSNPLTPVKGSVISSSNSIVSLPIYDSTAALAIQGNNTADVTIVGFLQVFINQVNSDGSLNLTVLNVAGCGSAASGTAVTGSSPVPVRLITPP